MTPNRAAPTALMKFDKITSAHDWGKMFALARAHRPAVLGNLAAFSVKFGLTLSGGNC
jgi:hypothetical protein